MIPNSIDHILKPKSSQLMLQNREVSEENLEYVSRKKLEKLKASYQNSLNKCKTPAPKSLSQHFDDKSNYSLKTVKKRNVFRGPGSSHDKLSGEIYSSRLNPYKTTYDDDYNLCRTQKNNLKAKIQDKLQNSTEVLQKKLAYVNGLKKNSVPNLPNFNNGVTYDNFIQKTAEKRERKNKITFLNETPKNDLYYPNEKSNNNNENYNNKLEDYDPNENNYNSDLKENNSQVFPECDTPDWNSISESHWQNLLNSDVFKNYNINPITLIENNPDYFSHLLGLCACVRCRCGLCRCKYAESKNANLRLVPNTNITMYQREYFDKSNDFKQNSGLFSIPFPNEKFQSKGFDYTTTHQSEFRPFAVHPHQRQTSNYHDNKYPFLSLSTYNSNFVDWRNYNSIKAVRPQNVTTIKELPFFDRTTYKDNFLNMKADPSNTDFVKSIQKRRPKIGIFSNVPFMAETQHNMNFKPYKIDKPIEGAQSKLLIAPSNLEILNQRPQEGHYMSMTLHDFKGAQDQICPAKQKIDLNSLKSQIFSKMSNINKDYHSNKTEERRTDGPHKRRIS